MVKLLTPSRILLVSLLLASLACSVLTGGGGDQLPQSNPPADQPASGSGSQSIRQWATSATASTEYAPDSWAAYQATGAPNVIECSDNEYAWASGPSDTLEWIELTFGTPVSPTEINIHQSYTPSQVVKVEVFSADGSAHVAWAGTPQLMSQCPYIMNIGMDLGGTVKVQKVKITIDQSVLGAGWNEIDAVELVGAP